MKFRVAVTGLAVVRGVVEVVASDERDAAAEAVRKATAGDVSWAYDGIYEGSDIEAEEADVIIG